MPGVGEKFRPSLNLLKGVVLQYNETPKKLEQKGIENKEDTYLKYIPESKISMNISKRFEVLFQVKDQWSLEELEPYVKPLVKSMNVTISELLLKHTRVAVDKNGKKLYQKR